MDQDDDRAGYDLGATGRLALMAKLAEGTGLKVPEAAASALSLAASQKNPAATGIMPPIATQCFMLSNMFDPATGKIFRFYIFSKTFLSLLKIFFLKGFIHWIGEMNEFLD